MGGTAGAHVEDNTTKEYTTASSGGASLEAHVSETSQVTFSSTHAIEAILGAHPIDNTFWDNTNPTDVSVDPVNSEEQMEGSHITKFHTPGDEQIVLAKLLSQADQNFDNQLD